MSCPHSMYGSPASCSLCVGAVARRVDIANGEVMIDDHPTGRASDPGIVSAYTQLARNRKRRRK